MRRPAKILLAGALLAIPMLPPFSGVATSQSTATNVQVQLGDVFSTQTLNVVDVSDATSATTTATGNAVTGAVETGSLNAQSTQTFAGTASALTHLYVTTNSGAQTSINTVATGNAAEVDSLGGGGLTAGLTQVASGPLVKSENDFNAAAAQTGAASVNSQAVANSIGASIVGGASSLTTNQSSAAFVDAESGSEPASGATLQYTPGTAAFSALAVSNNLTTNGTSSASQTINATQTATGTFTQAGQFVDVGQGQTVQGAATATANNISANNAGGDLNVTDSQSNASYTYGDSVATAYSFGTGQATAEGVGNSVMAANAGPTTELSNTQTNTNGTEATASFTGGNGYDASASATAVANAVTGFACSDCGGVLTATNSQTNSGGVGAAATVTITGSNRSVNSVATATGNSATFYVSKPSN